MVLLLPVLAAAGGIQAQINSHCTGSAPVSSVTVTCTCTSPLSLSCMAARCSAVSVATARKAPGARLLERHLQLLGQRQAVVTHVHAHHHAGGRFGQQRHGRSVHAVDVVLHPALRWPRPLPRAGRQRDDTRSPAVPVKGTARRSTRLRTQGRSQRRHPVELRQGDGCQRLGRVAQGSARGPCQLRTGLPVTEHAHDAFLRLGVLEQRRRRPGAPSSSGIPRSPGCRRPRHHPSPRRRSGWQCGSRAR